MQILYRRQRQKSKFGIQLSGPAVKQAAEIVDVNEYGARLRTTKGLERGDVVHFSVLYTSITASVQWTNKHEAGITFRPAIDDRTLALIRQAAINESSRHFNSRSLPEMR